MGIIILIFPVTFPLFPPPIGGVGKSGKQEHSQIFPKREKWEKREPIFFICFFYKGAVFLVNNVINLRFYTRASWSLVWVRLSLINELGSVYTRASWSMG